MTIEERFERIEHVTVGLAEERRKDREEFRQLWRDTQRQINELGSRVIAFEETAEKWASELRQADEEARKEFRQADQLAREEFRQADAALGKRIDALVSAIGEFIAQQGRNR
jgi:hypothetical protein